MKALAVLDALGLFVIGVLHALWAFSPWPFGTWTKFARTVLGATDGQVPASLPPFSVAVAVLLFAAAYIVLGRAKLMPEPGPKWIFRAGVWVVGLVLLVRGTVGGLVPSALGLGGAPDSYTRADLLIYSPLCIVLGGIAIVVALSARRREASGQQDSSPAR